MYAIRSYYGIKTISLIAKAVSDTGKVVASDPVTIKVQFKKVAKPVVTITSPNNENVLDTTTGQKTIEVTANATISDGSIAKTIIYADNVKIGEALGDSCTATYTAPNGDGPKPDGIINVTFTAVAVSDENEQGNALPVTIKVKLPVPQEPPVSDSYNFV